MALKVYARLCVNTTKTGSNQKVWILNKTTIEDVNRVAGVSTMTVSRTINNSGYVKQSTQEKLESAIE